MTSNQRIAVRERDRSMYLLRRWTTRIVVATVGFTGAVTLLAASSIPGRGASGPLAAVGSAFSSILSGGGDDGASSQSGSTSPGGAPAQGGGTAPATQAPSGGVTQPSGGSPVTVSGGS